MWVRSVTTDSTHPPQGTFTGFAANIARTMAGKDVSPGRLGSGIRMIQYVINRGGRCGSRMMVIGGRTCARLSQPRMVRHC